MPYLAEISRINPSCFIFLVDQSASMIDSIGNEAKQSKADVVADALNRLLTELAIRCAKEEGVRDYFHVAVIGYGGRTAQSAFGGVLEGQGLVPISRVADNPLRVEQRTRLSPDGAGGVVELKTDFPIWVQPAANGATPMCHALAAAKDLVANWTARYSRSFPPIVLNLTDGEANDGDPHSAARELVQLRTDDGAALLFNLHISAAGGSPVTFPADVAGLPDAYARSLFEMSSELPPHMRDYAASNHHAVTTGSRGFVYNADIVALIQFLDIGTRALALR
ncbi:MAG TPA: vWA domain-containing protein [Trebonia sp.]